ncbi:ABC transporter permease [Listeria welshimeri]|uniref:Transport permease protein n=1 Tax=Listeria welshimeri TaxID=1643 RepID=A0A7X0T7Q6_LISWE|nr:ABC transporter permease [Listeria welshimeri]
MRRIIIAELKRLFLNEYTKLFHYISLLLWPLLMFIQLFFNFYAFPIDSLAFLGIYSQKELFSFLFVGFIALLIFQSMVQSAWIMSFEKRQGTLEVIFITPINKTLWLYSRTFSVVVVNSFVLLILLCISITLTLGITIIIIIQLILMIIAIMISSLIWGTLLNILFLYFRDGSLVFSILAGPEETFAGVKVPVSVMPTILKFISGLIPLTYTVNLIREIFFLSSYWRYNLIAFLIVNLILICISVFLFKRIEKGMRKNGNLSLY